MDCQEEFETFVKTMDLLGDKLGPIVFQFPHFDKYQVKDRHALTDRLLPFFKTLPSGHQFAVEIRNHKWLDAEFADVLRSFNVALVAQDIHTMPRPSEMTFDPITADFSYVRLLGNRKQIEMTTTVWEKIVEDKTESVSGWVKYCQTVQRRGQQPLRRFRAGHSREVQGVVAQDGWNGTWEVDERTAGTKSI